MGFFNSPNRENITQGWRLNVAPLITKMAEQNPELRNRAWQVFEAALTNPQSPETVSNYLNSVRTEDTPPESIIMFNVDLERYRLAIKTNDLMEVSQGNFTREVSTRLQEFTQLDKSLELQEEILNKRGGMREKFRTDLQKLMPHSRQFISSVTEIYDNQGGDLAGVENKLLALGQSFNIPNQIQQFVFRHVVRRTIAIQHGALRKIAANIDPNAPILEPIRTKANYLKQLVDQIDTLNNQVIQ